MREVVRGVGISWFWVKMVLLLAAVLFVGGIMDSDGAVIADGVVPPSFMAFESEPVRPMALTPSGERVVVVNIPDNRLELFAVGVGGLLSHTLSIAVGMEPVAVAARTDNEVWVVNHLSDSVSVVDLAAGRVVRTLLVGDEPRDIVFGGVNRERAFITTAHRGQQRMDVSLAAVEGAGDAQLTTPSVGRADVWVFDAQNLGQTMGGTPLKIIELFGDTPRALAVTPDGSTVYAAVFHSGNQTAVVPMPLVCTNADPTLPCDGDGITSPNGLPNGQMPGGNLAPWTNHEGVPMPLVGLVVKYNNESGIWEDEKGRNWSNAIRFHLPDLDVFAIDAQTLQESARYAHVGTTLFNMVVNPVNGKLYVSNTEAKNEVRFEGQGVFGNSTVQGNLAQSRVTVIDPLTAEVMPRHLNKHINYDIRPAPAGTKEHSLATPLEMVVSADGTTLFVAAFGSSKIGVFATSALENDTFDPTVESANYISVSGGGPGGLLLDESRQRLFVFTRFDNGLSVIDTTTGAELQHLLMYNPEPQALTAGRPMLYDAYKTSSNGEASCSSCHIFGDMDHLAWDLGNPDADVSNNPLAILFEHLAESNAEAYSLNGSGNVRDFHPMKGPMLTQSLRGMANSGAMHWRGDRATGFFGDSAADERLSFKNFIVAFEGLLGDTTPATDAQRQADMEAFADFALALTYPPNPNRQLDNSLTASQVAGADLFDGPRRLDGAPESYDAVTGNQEGSTCEECHRVAPEVGFFGTAGQATFEGLTQIVKTPHLRNLYTRIGMFGMANTWLVVDENVPRNSNEHMGDQIRGYGFNHDGIYDTLFRFTLGGTFNDNGFPDSGFANNQERLDVEAYLLAFDSDLAPIVGQQVTLDATNEPLVGERLDLLITRAQAPFTSKILGGSAQECDLVVHGSEWALLYDAKTNLFTPDWTDSKSLTDGEVRQWVRDNNSPLTYTCVPYGSGKRIALDRDLDGFFNGDERAAGSNPADATSTPENTNRIALSEMRVQSKNHKEWLLIGLMGLGLVSWMGWRGAFAGRLAD